MQMDKLRVEQRILNEALKFLTPQQQEQLTNWRLQELKRAESNSSGENAAKELPATKAEKSLKVTIKKSQKKGDK